MVQSPSSDVAARSGWISGFDGLRGLAILFVLGRHFWVQAGLPAARPWTSVLEAGWAGVDLFFVLSGFLITRILLRTRGKPHYYPRFLVNRSLRILPLYACVMAYSTLVHLLRTEGRLVGAELVSPLWSMFINWPSGLNRPVVETAAVTWSLAIEEQFYLVWPWLVAALSRRRLAVLAALLVALSPLIRAGVCLAWSPAAAYYWTVCRSDGLALGALAALLTEAGPSPLRSTVVRWAPAVVAATAVAVVAGLGTNINTLPFVVGGYSVFAVGSVCALLAVHDGAWPAVNRALDWGPLRWVGRISFGLYLLHILALPIAHALVLRAVGDPAHDPVALLAFAVAGPALSLLLAQVSWHYLEEPLLRLKEPAFDAWRRLAVSERR